MHRVPESEPKIAVKWPVGKWIIVNECKENVLYGEGQTLNLIWGDPLEVNVSIWGGGGREERQERGSGRRTEEKIDIWCRKAWVWRRVGDRIVIRERMQ